MGKIVVISHPQNIEKEHEAIEALFEAGLELFHLRKPDLNIVEMQLFLEKIPANRLSQITLHDHFELSQLYPIGGLHLNARNTYLPPNFSGRISCSCHSIHEVEEKKPLSNYVFLSPIFNSISKQNYSSAFNLLELKKASEQDVIDDKVIALGGILPENKKIINELHFGGIAVLGYLWEDFSASQDIKQLIKKFGKLLDC